MYDTSYYNLGSVTQTLSRGRLKYGRFLKSKFNNKLLYETLHVNSTNLFSE